MLKWYPAGGPGGVLPGGIKSEKVLSSGVSSGVS
jgi:hypothetical protein